MGWLSNSVSYFKQIWSKLSHLEGRPVTAGSVTTPSPAEQPHKREERTGKAERDVGKHNATSWGQRALAGEHSRDQGGSGLGGPGLSSKCPVNPEGRRKTGTIGPRAPSCGRGKHCRFPVLGDSVARALDFHKQVSLFPSLIKES